MIYNDDLSTDELDPLKRLFPDFFEELAIRQTPLRGVKDFLEENGEFNYCFFQQGIDRNVIIALVHNSKTKVVEGITIKDREVIKLFGLNVDKKKTSK